MVYALINPFSAIKLNWENYKSRENGSPPDEVIFYVYAFDETLKKLMKKRKELVLPKGEGVFSRGEEAITLYTSEVLLPLIMRAISAVGEYERTGSVEKFALEVLKYQYAKDVLHTALSASATKRSVLRLLTKDEMAEVLKEAKREIDSKPDAYQEVDSENAKNVLAYLFKTAGLGIAAVYYFTKKVKGEMSEDELNLALARISSDLMDFAEKNAKIFDVLIAELDDNSESKELIEEYRRLFGTDAQIANAEQPIEVDELFDTVFTLMLVKVVDQQLRKALSGELKDDEVVNAVMQALLGIKGHSGGSYIM